MRLDQHMPEKKQPASRLDISDESRPGELMAMLRVRGVIDVDSSRALDHYLRTRLPPGSRYVLLNLSEVTRLGQAGVRVLHEHASRLAAAGRALLAIAPTSDIRRTLQSRGAAEVLGVHHSLSAAIASCQIAPRVPVARDAAGAGDRLEALDPQRMARALSIIQERHGVTDADAAYELLRDSAQQHNLPLSALVSAFLADEAPRQLGGENGELPRRHPKPSPPLTFCLRDRGNDRTAVLSSFLEVALGCMRASAADIQLVDVLDGTLRPELRRGPAVASAFSAMALERKERVVAHEILDRALVDARFQVVQSTPLLVPGGRCVGVVSTYHANPGHTPSKLQCAKLDFAAAEIATWLEWHQQTVVVDALEHLYQRACQAPGSRDRELRQ